jgi:hypothetical protein
MSSLHSSFLKLRALHIFALCAFLSMTGSIVQSQVAGAKTENAQEQGNAPAEQTPLPQFDKAIFQNPIPGDQLAFLNNFAKYKSGKAIRDKQFRNLIPRIVPDCEFHYGHDMPLLEAINTVIDGSSQPVQIREGRYLMISGHSGPYLEGRGFLWIDMQDGLALGGFYFRPTNGEPTPAVNIFSQQVREATLTMNQLPPAFADDLSRWSAENDIRLVTTRYFINGYKEKIVLLHDEDYCAPRDGSAARSKTSCQQMNADAADVDERAAEYVDQTGHVTNATAWMINGRSTPEWIQIRDSTCRLGPDPLGCYIILTRQHTRIIIYRHPQPPIR